MPNDTKREYFLILNISIHIIRVLQTPYLYEYLNVTTIDIRKKIHISTKLCTLFHTPIGLSEETPSVVSLSKESAGSLSTIFDISN